MGPDFVQLEVGEPDFEARIDKGLVFPSVEGLLRDPGLCNQGQHAFAAEHSVNHYLPKMGWVVAWNVVLLSKPTIAQLSQRTANIRGQIIWAEEMGSCQPVAGSLPI